MRVAITRCFSALLGSALTAGILAVPTPASAVAPTAAPEISAPVDGSTVSGNPVLGWSPVDGAVKYRVQLHADPAFPATGMLATIDTVNTQATPTKELPLGVVYWRVAATDGGAGIGPYNVSSFIKEYTAAPNLSSPADRAELVYPTDKPVFAWEPLAGAARYRLEVALSEEFVSPVVAQTTPNTSYALTSPQTSGQDFYWRVRGESVDGGVVSAWSAVRRYSVSWPQSAAPQLLYPAPVNVGEDVPVVQDIVMRWSAVAGAASYHLQVSPSVDFATTTIDTTVAGTSYSPAATLSDGPYYWRVRAKDTSATSPNVGPWSDPVGSFIRRWNEKVTLLGPDDGALVVDPPTMSWKPMQPGVVDDPTTADDESLSSLATYYRVEVSTDSNFSSGNMTCITYRTEYTPYIQKTPTLSPTVGTCNIDLVDGRTYWWRVRAVDLPSNVQGADSAKRSFTFRKGGVQGISLLAPGDGATVDDPALSWTTVQDVKGYEVSINVNGSLKLFRTSSTSFTPTQLLVGASQLPRTFSWTVRPIDLEGNVGVAPAPRLFTLVPPTFAPDTPVSIDLLAPLSDSHSPRMPQFKWTHVQGATEYLVEYMVGDAGVWFPYGDGAKQPYPSFTHSGASLLQAGTYYYRVKAVSSTGGVLVTSPARRFIIDPLAPATLRSAGTCTTPTCVSPLTDTPTFTWDPVPNAGLYKVHLYTDSGFQGIESAKVYWTEHTRLTPRESLTERNAGEAAFFWFVQPCVTEFVCGPMESPFSGSRSFQKRSAPVDGLSPAHGTKVTGPVTFRWNDYLQTNQSLSSPAVQEAKLYRIEVSRVADFTTLLDYAEVDQTTYTPHALNKAYPDGPLYWRVQAIDASGNKLTFSHVPGAPATEHHLVTKDQPEVVQHDVQPGAIALTWDAQPFTTKYDVEIYKNGDLLWSPVNRMATTTPSAAGWSGTTRTTAWTPTKALEQGTYAWRVRRYDNTLAPGGAVASYDDWSVGKTFTVAAPAPVLVAPAVNSPESDGSVLFSWNPVVGAAGYRVDIASNSAFSSPIETVFTTVMTQFANTKALPVGTIHWRVTPLNGEGTPMGPSATRTLRRVVAGDYFSLPPARILDTRSGLGAVPGGTAIDLQVTGAGGVPEEHVTAVVLNVTVTQPTGNGYLTVWPSGGDRPVVSNLNFVAGQTVPNLVKVKVGEGGRVSFFNSVGFTHVIADVAGYYTDGVPVGGSTLTPLSSARLLNTTTSGVRISGGTSRELLVTGVGGVPASGVGAVVLNVTSSGSTGGGYLTVYPKGTTRPQASNLNFVKGVAVSNLVVAKVPASGRVMLYPSASTHAQVDVVGWYTNGTQGAGKHFNSLEPVRILDSRKSGGALAPSASRTVKVTGVGGVPATGVTAVIMNVTAVTPTATGALTVYPGTSKPVGPNVSFIAKRNVPNLVLVQVSGNAVTVHNSAGSTHVIFDVVGWVG